MTDLSFIIDPRKTTGMTIDLKASKGYRKDMQVLLEHIALEVRIQEAADSRLVIMALIRQQNLDGCAAKN